MVEEPLKIYHTAEAYYLDHLRSLCARAETPTSLVEGKSLDEHACYTLLGKRLAAAQVLDLSIARRGALLIRRYS